MATQSRSGPKCGLVGDNNIIVDIMCKGVFANIADRVWNVIFWLLLPEGSSFFQLMI